MNKVTIYQDRVPVDRELFKKYKLPETDFKGKIKVKDLFNMETELSDTIYDEIKDLVKGFNTTIWYDVKYMRLGRIERLDITIEARDKDLTCE